MVRLESFCWLLPIKIGTIIIGAISALMLLMGIISGSWWPIMIDGLSTVFFVYMLYRDKAVSRMLYFGAYLTLAAILFIVRLVYIVRNPQHKTIVRNYCNDLEMKVVYAGTHNTAWAITDYKSYPDCLSQVGSNVWKEEAVLLIIVAAFQIYFSIVLWTHA